MCSTQCIAKVSKVKNRKNNMAHLVGKIHGVKINTVDELNELMNSVARECKFNVVGNSFHQFEPYGATGVLVLAESHFSAHTYPENDMVYIDVFCCAKDFMPYECADIIKKTFQAQKAEWRVIPR
jgi:S-adenosylmethionine decarboxylase proenzyme